MSTAKWGGVKLRDVLEECGIDVDDIALGKVESPFQHLQLEGYDQDETGYTYGGSIPWLKAVDGLSEVILAYEMNGEDLPRDHGFRFESSSRAMSGPGRSSGFIRSS